MFDSHLHTKFSTDSKMNINDALKRSSDLNIGIVITEHIDLNYPVEGKFIFNTENYLRDYARYRNDKLLLGIEMGIREDCVEENKKLSQNNQIDYIIGSVHVVDNMDLYESIVYEGKKKSDVYSHYLKTMLECIKKHDFIDSLGHIDYIARYAKFKDNEIYYTDFRDEIDEILITLIQNEKAIELNTRRIRDSKAVESLLQIYRRYYELGGRIVTIGSDAHIPENIGANFDIAKEIIDTCNLKMVYFKERKPNYL